MRNNELHVVPTAEGWQITPAPENNQDETFDTRTEAVVAALHAAEIENLDVIVHSDDGTIVNMPLTSDISGKSAAAQCGIGFSGYSKSCRRAQTAFVKQAWSASKRSYCLGQKQSEQHVCKARSLHNHWLLS